MPYSVAAVRGKSSLAPTFTGLLDLVPGAAAGYSVARKLRAAYAGSAIRLREDAGNTEMDFGFTGATYETDVAAIAAWILGAGATNAYVVKIYDQSGNTRDATQATAGAQPLYVASNQNGKPGSRFDGTDDRLATLAVTLPQPNTVYVLFIQRGWAGNGRILYASAKMDVIQRSSSPRVAIWASGSEISPISPSGKPALNSAVLFTSIFNGDTNSIIELNNDGDTTGANTGTVGPSSTILSIGAIQNGTSPAQVDIVEMIIYNSLQTTERSTVKTNENSFYAIY